MGSEPPRHEGPLRAFSDARRLDDRVSGSGHSARPAPAAQTYAITGPGWSGTLPAGVKELKSPTSLVWLLGRIYCTGTPEDYAAVHALQDEIKLVPLSSYGKTVHAAARRRRSQDRHEDAQCASR